MANQIVSQELHNRFLRTAGRVSPRLREAIRAAGPVSAPTPRQRKLAHFLCQCIVGQQLSVAAARTIWGRVRDLLSEQSGGIPAFFHSDNEALLRGRGLSRNKAKALSAVREAHRAGALSPKRLSLMDATQRAEHLMRIWGVGQWTADMTSIFFFGDTDIWPRGDVAACNTLARLIDDNPVLETDDVAARFAPHRSLLALYMWRVVDALPAEVRGK